MGWPWAHAHRGATRATAEGGTAMRRLELVEKLAAMVRAAPVQPPHGGGCPPRPLAGACARLRLGWLLGQWRQECRMGWPRARARRMATRTMAASYSTSSSLPIVVPPAAVARVATRPARARGQSMRHSCRR